mmetsp:Transcript_29666/g.84871  ORF Transcript_29666/g.84871 Transcript_29666/m.84871 type:complete len:235 (+) Transcript_29666:70-774(+)
MSVWASLRRLGERYARLSTNYPFPCSLLTAGSVLFTADVTCQTLSRGEGEAHDWRRTAALTIWGTWHYGIPQKFWYMQLERHFGTGQAVKKMFFDVYVNTPFHLVPSFYFGTGLIRGEKTVKEIAEQLQREWLEVNFKTALFWTPLVTLNFRYVPQHSQILTICCASFIHKTWLSWISNREALAAKRAAAAVESPSATAAQSLPKQAGCPEPNVLTRQGEERSVLVAPTVSALQ